MVGAFFMPGEIWAFLCPFLRKEVSTVANRIMGITVEIGGDTTKLQTAKVVYVRNRNKRKEYLCLISTDVNLDENEIIRVYGKRWDIEVFFKVCKSYLKRPFQVLCKR